jgi:hypothetical protein
MRRYRIEAWGADHSGPLSSARCSWPTLTRAVGDDPDLVADCAALRIGQFLAVGGGAAPITRITREA